MTCTRSVMQFLRLLIGAGVAQLFYASMGHASGESAPCANYSVNLNGEEIAVPKPTGFVDICATRSPLCHTLIDGFPKSVTTLAYFVKQTRLPSDATNERSLDFSRYYIAQLQNKVRPEEFPAIKREIVRANGERSGPQQASRVTGTYGNDTAGDSRRLAIFNYLRRSDETHVPHRFKRPSAIFDRNKCGRIGPRPNLHVVLV